MSIDIADRRYPDVVFDRLHVCRFVYSAPPADGLSLRGVKAEAKLVGVSDDGANAYLPEALRFSSTDFNSDAVRFAIKKGEAADADDFAAQNAAHLSAIDARHEAGDITLAEAQAWFEYSMGLLFTINGSLDGFEGVK
jgi:hypothetical protein